MHLTSRTLFLSTFLFLKALLIVCLSGCTQRVESLPSPVGRDGEQEESSRSGDRESSIVAAAMVNGQAVGRDELHPLLAEMAGNQILQEVILKRQLDAALAERGLSIAQAAVQRERELMRQTLTNKNNTNTAETLLERVRARQGLGPQRFKMLLQRNAGLRLLVRDQVKVGEQAMDRAYDLAHGPQRQVRLIVVPTLREAERIIDQLSRKSSFADLAVAHSTDASAARGGLLAPIARRDPSYPAALREAMWALKVGEASNPILIDGGYAILQLVGEITGDGISRESVRPAMRVKAQRAQERLLMNQTARRLIEEASVTVFDDQLDWSWSQR